MKPREGKHIGDGSTDNKITIRSLLARVFSRMIVLSTFTLRCQRPRHVVLTSLVTNRSQQTPLNAPLSQTQASPLMSPLLQIVGKFKLHPERSPWSWTLDSMWRNQTRLITRPQRLKGKFFRKCSIDQFNVNARHVDGIWSSRRKQRSANATLAIQLQKTYHILYEHHGEQIQNLKDIESGKKFASAFKNVTSSLHSQRQHMTSVRSAVVHIWSW